MNRQEKGGGQKIERNYCQGDDVGEEKGKVKKEHHDPNPGVIRESRVVSKPKGVFQK